MTDAVRPTVFVVSPAHCGGKRAALLLGPAARFPLAEQLRRDEGASLGEAFSFLSSLYFRGKLTYARRFARPPQGVAGVQVITPNRGLMPAETVVGAQDLVEFGTVDIRPDDDRYRGPLERDALRLATGGAIDVVLLGSLATGKYVDVLLAVLGERLFYPAEFAGRGDMSRGALLLRAAREGGELAYRPVSAVLRAPRRR